MTRGLTWAGCALAASMLLAACGQESPLETTETAGPGPSQVRVLVEQGAAGALGSDIQEFVATRPVRVSWGSGTADEIATTVKQGYRFSVVVLPTGPALDRIRDELLAPPTRLGRLGSTTYWACPVDRYGLPFMRFLTGRTSTRLLRANGFDVSP